MGSVRRIDYYHDPNAPRANALVVGGCAVAPDADGRILLQRRADNGEWALPGGGMDIGETFADCVIREVREETGFDVVIERIVGIYSDPGHVFAYPDGEIRQQFSICCACAIVGGELAVSDESTAVGFFALDQLAGLHMHETHRIRIRDYLANTSPVLR
ncbi:NUDIX domain-containing protein [Pseudofrankia sp. BMG5.37]|uniref:NUDIX domain-containing protein n=1 Tax=Pseudofrankia sp. BMG5.37 TaxID=3050035 RepID=UPI0008DAC2B5|nr:NUDIX domain-containing protein [Pseudofrankia sp. BMG5.37]OHV63308.1 NUDIX hydrolase [Pseudofrankia sp. BMG5.36]